MTAKSQDGARTVEFECFDSSAEDYDDCSSEACQHDISAALTTGLEVEEDIEVQLGADEGQSNTAAIWEVNLSRADESNKLEGGFVREARERIRELKETPDFNTQLSFVSIVGKRGVGKSTLASLLSGNSSMFQVALQKYPVTFERNI